MKKPNFLYIGIARAGSTWLFEMLRQHPEVFVPPAKDVYFFDRYFEKGLTWYFSHFKHADEAKAIGELSHDYYFSERALKRIHETLPEVRLILCLREPVGRLVSGFVYNRTTALRSGVSLADYAAQEEIATQFEYYHHLKRYIDCFGRDRVLVVFFEDMVEEPEKFIRTVYRFLDVDDSFVPPNLHERINPARDARAESLALFAYRVALLLRRLGLSNLVGRIKESKLVNRFLYKAPTEGLAEKPSTELIARLRRDHARLESLIGRPLPQSWHV
ncbi:MAG: sulfotransferase [Candidatus Hydrogenedentes bacterium]|nr:sulfotransferase [Candidatus Hydrogenedentota bacterium]